MQSKNERVFFRASYFLLCSCQNIFFTKWGKMTSLTFSPKSFSFKNHDSLNSWCNYPTLDYQSLKFEKTSLEGRAIFNLY